MKVITAPQNGYSVEVMTSHGTLFLAGGITDCPNWQQEIITLLKKTELILFNPRQEDFDISDPNAAEKQICWEYQHLKRADAILFWFARGSLNPIVLYELGRWGNASKKQIFVGCDEQYARTQDVTIQTKLSRPEISIATSISELADQVMQTFY